jgi:hypothetical protein
LRLSKIKISNAEMACNTSNCNIDPCYSIECCDVDYEGRIIDLIFVKKSTTLNKTTVELFMTSILQAEADGEAIILRNVNGELPLPDTAELLGRGRQQSYPGPHTFTLTADEFSVVNNIQFYNDFRRQTNKYDLYFVSPNVIWDASGNAINFKGAPVIQKDINTYIQGQAIVMWVTQYIPSATVCFDDNTFNICPNPIIQKGGIDYSGEAITVPVAEIFGPPPTEVTISTITAVSPYDGVTLDNLVWSVEEDPAKPLPACVTVDDNLDTGSVTFTAAGTCPTSLSPYTVYIVVSNASGCLESKVPITITLVDA